MGVGVSEVGVTVPPWLWWVRGLEQNQSNIRRVPRGRRSRGPCHRAPWRRRPRWMPGRFGQEGCSCLPRRAAEESDHSQAQLPILLPPQNCRVGSCPHNFSLSSATPNSCPSSTCSPAVKTVEPVKHAVLIPYSIPGTCFLPTQGAPDLSRPLLPWGALAWLYLAIPGRCCPSG